MTAATADATADATTVNRAFYDTLWQRVHWPAPERFNTWSLVARWCAQAATRLEIGPGMRPRLPVAGTHFIDLSTTCVARLAQGGAQATCGSATDLPFADRHFAL